MRIVIAGGHGQIARQFGKLVAGDGHEAVAMVRNPEHVPDLEEDGIETAIIDLEDTDVDAMTEVVRGADAVVFAAGGGADGNAARKETVDKGAAIMLADAAEAAGVRRYVMISVDGDRRAPTRTPTTSSRSTCAPRRQRTTTSAVATSTGPSCVPVGSSTTCRRVRCSSATSSVGR